VCSSDLDERSNLSVKFVFADLFDYYQEEL
jgi:hypothetical protein